MIGKMMSMGFELATMPARLTWRSARAMTMTPAQFQQFSDELRQASEDVAREIQTVITGVDAEMTAKAAHLSPEQTVSYTHLTLPTTLNSCRSRWSPYH